LDIRQFLDIVVKQLAAVPIKEHY